MANHTPFIMDPRIQRFIDDAWKQIDTQAWNDVTPKDLILIQTDIFVRMQEHNKEDIIAAVSKGQGFHIGKKTATTIVTGAGAAIAGILKKAGVI
jgi:hypothetical protein